MRTIHAIGLFALIIPGAIGLACGEVDPESSSPNLAVTLSPTPSLTPTSESIAAPHPEPSASPTPEPSSSPTPEPSATPTSTPLPAATPTLEPTATYIPVPVPAVLLDLINAAMGHLKTFHFEGEVFAKTSKEAEAELFYIHAEGEGEPRGDSRSQITMRLKIEGMDWNFSFEERDVDGISYAQDPTTNIWEIDEEESDDDGALFAILTGQLELENILAEVGQLDGVSMYQLSGSAPDEPGAEQQQVKLWAGIDDLLVRQVSIEAIGPRSEWDFIIPPDHENVYLSTRYRLDRFDEPVKVVAPSLVATPEAASTSPPPAATTTPSEPPTPTAEEHFTRAFDLFQQSRFEEAIAELDEAIRLMPIALFYSSRGDVYNVQGEYDQAILSYQEAVLLDPQSVDMYFNIGLMHYELGQYEQAVGAYGEAIKIDPTDAEIYNNRGNAHGALGQHEQAVEDLDEAIRLNPQLTIAYLNRGREYSDLGEYEQAIKDFDEVIRRDPNAVYAVANRAIAHAMLGEDADAELDIDRAVQLGVDELGLRTELRAIKQNLVIESTSSAYGFTIFTPQDWIIPPLLGLELGLGVIEFAALHPSGAAQVSIVVEDLSSIEPNLSLEQYVSVIKSVAIANFELEELSRRMFTVDDIIEAWEISWTRDFPNVGKEQGKWVIFLKDGNGFVINAFAEASQHEQFEPTLDAILSNFTFSVFITATTSS